MPLPTSVVEIVGSRDTQISIDDPRQELLFTVTGPTDEPTVRGLVEGALSATLSISSAFFGTLTLVIQGYKVKERASGIWDGSAQYGRRQPRKTGDLIYTFDGTAGQTHIQTSIATNYAVGIGVTGNNGPGFNGIPDHKNSIGVNDQQVAGVDIPTPLFKFTLEFYPPNALVTDDYIMYLSGLSSLTNHAPWSFAPTNFPGVVSWDDGEVLFLGATGQPRSLDDWQISMHFIGAQNVSFVAGDEPIQIGDLDPIYKDGHEYVWVNFADESNNSRVVKRPKFGYVEQVFDKGDYSRLFTG